MSPRTWIDVSDLLAWRGVRTGIPRVVAHLVTRYATKPDVRFFTYSDRGRSFREVDRAIVVAAALRPTGAARRPGLTPEFRWLSDSVLGALRRRLPPPAKRRLRSIEATARARWADVAVRVRPASVGSVAPSARRIVGRSNTPFESGDRLLILGAGWASASLQQALVDQKHVVGLRVYQVLYDLTPILLPQCFGPGFSAVYARYLFEAMSLSDGMISISQRSRADALRFCEGLLLPAPPINVFRLGDEPIAGPDGPEPVDSLTDQDFILSVGTIESRKNHLLLYQAWKRAQELERALPILVIVGRPGWAANDTIYAMRNDPAVNGSIHLLDEVSDARLQWLYERCLFTIYPSLYEGWGLPIAESLARSKLCLASSSSAMPEVAGDLIDYFSPYDAGECLRLIERYLDPDTLSAKARQIEAQYRVTSWDAAFADFESALQRLPPEPAASDPRWAAYG